jgi:ABC-type transporter Mla subunit MlaD
MQAQTARKLAKLALVAALVAVVAVLIMSGGGYSHSVQTVVPDATGVIPGERVVAAGLTVGSITSATVTRNGQAHLVMGIDNSIWPLPTDTVLTLRMGGTIKYTDRFVLITRGRSGAVFSDRAYIPAKQFVAPIEYDTVFNTFDSATRAGLKSFLNNAGPALTNVAPSFRQALGDAAPALSQATAVFSDLSYNQQALTALVNSTDDVVNAVARSNPGVQQLLQGAANTFTAVASQSHNLQAALSEAPQALQNAGHVTVHATSTLNNVAALSDRLNPGITELRALASPLNSALRTVVAVAPHAIHTLTTVRNAAPSLDTLLNAARTILMPRLQSIGRQAAKQVNCIRPYTPELFNLVSQWADFLGHGDLKDTTMRGNFGPTAMTNVNPINSAQLGAVLPGLAIDFPQVPGGIVNQPWYQPQCHITSDSYKLAADPEANTLDPLAGKIVPYPSSP